MVAIHWRWRKQQRDGVRTQQNSTQSIQNRSHDIKTFYLLAVLPALRLQRHHSDRTQNQKNVQSQSSNHFHNNSEHLEMERTVMVQSRKTKKIEIGALSLLAIEGSDLEAEAAVVTVNRHDRTVVKVCDEPARHLSSALLHQITALREEVLTLPG